jgi:hypothetical protein
MWARVHKIDRIRPQVGGSAIVLVEDERTAANMARVPSLSTIIAIARVLNARRVLATKFGGKGEVRYATSANPPQFLFDAIVRAGAHLADRDGNEIRMPAQPAAIAADVDRAFSELAYNVRSSNTALDIAAALKLAEAQRRKSPLDKEANPASYWSAVFELAALAGELARPRGGRWIDTTDMPVPFAVRLATGELARPTKLAAEIVENTASESLSGEGVGDNIEKLQGPR